MAQTKQYDCQTCGACCGPSSFQPWWAGIGWHDVIRLYKHDARYHLKVIRDEVGMGIKTKMTKNGTQCVELRGTVGKQVACSIYEHRPEVCRQFPAGSTLCQEARVAAGVDPYESRLGIHVQKEV